MFRLSGFRPLLPLYRVRTLSNMPRVQLHMDSPLPAQLATAPPEATHLDLDTDIPSDSDWAILSSHFTSVTHLRMDSGNNEELGDIGIPLHWPLQKLTIGSACSDACRSPWIIEGRVKHLVLYYTHGLRFEGPTTTELVKANREAIARGEKEAEKVGKLTITYVPDLVADWMREKYAREEKEGTQKEHIPPADLQLRTLEIVENDVLDTLFRYTLAHPSLFDPIETLNLVAPGPNDLFQGPDDILHLVLPQLEATKTLVLTIGDFYQSRNLLPKLVESLPPNLEVLRFRSSVSLVTKGPALFNSKWVQKFADPTFLPNLKSLSFILDLKDGEEERRRSEDYVANMDKDKKDETETEVEAQGGSSPDHSPDSTHTTSEKPVEVVKEGDERNEEAQVPSPSPSPAPETKQTKLAVSDEELAQARRACEQLWRAAEGRGVVVEPWSVVQTKYNFWDVAPELDDPALLDLDFAGVKPADERWDKV